MSVDASSRATRTTRRGGFQPRTAIAIAVVWTLMWDRLSWGNLINGLLVGFLVTFVFPLPPIVYFGRPRPLRVAALLARFLGDLVRAAIHVAVFALRRSDPPRGSIVAVQLRTRSDLYLTLVAVQVALVPGSVVIEARRRAGVLFVHDVDAVDAVTLEQQRRAVLAIERRLVRAIGTAEEIALVEEADR
ncbi:Na+/H+ antiporter subunit E [Cumulibacter manganitolerans]|uniref:Na+/H+ antiporter subunit E n=1 Tax=Cumulibacter manganitolerans TaxID=1884992 RepID=UPI0012963FF1|nr:Na+/H+ antiporter subunit E [Cumulibacter manganitolerans]